MRWLCNIMQWSCDSHVTGVQYLVGCSCSTTSLTQVSSPHSLVWSLRNRPWRT